MWVSEPKISKKDCIDTQQGERTGTSYKGYRASGEDICIEWDSYREKSHYVGKWPIWGKIQSLSEEVAAQVIVETGSLPSERAHQVKRKTGRRISILDLFQEYEIEEST